jgi:uncharacterized membrane protein YfcA
VIADPFFYALAVPAIASQGLARGGFAGVGALALPMLALAIDPVRAAAILLPILIVQDMVGVWAFRRTFDACVLAWMLPGAVVGIALGYGFASLVSPSAILAAVGGISILFGGWRLWVERRGLPVASASPGWVDSLFGVASGITRLAGSCAAVRRGDWPRAIAWWRSHMHYARPAAGESSRRDRSARRSHRCRWTGSRSVPARMWRCCCRPVAIN